MGFRRAHDEDISRLQGVEGAFHQIASFAGNEEKKPPSFVKNAQIVIDILSASML
jgi:hypothetical protein